MLLEYYQKNYQFNDLSSEDIIKLMEEPYLIREITNAFQISEKEFQNVRKKLGISNFILENIIRNIEAVLHYLDCQNRYFSERIRKKIVDNLVPIFLNSIPKKSFYYQELMKTDFSREKVLHNIQEKDIDLEYRWKNLSVILTNVEKKLNLYLEEEQKNLFHNNFQKKYQWLCEEVTKGKFFYKEDLTYDLLFELSIVENISDFQIASIFQMKKSEVKYLRKKKGLYNVIQTRLSYFPEQVIYSLEQNQKRLAIASNYEYEFVLNGILKSYSVKQNKKISDLTVNAHDTIFHVHYSNEDYNFKQTQKKQKEHSSKRNQQKEAKVKRLHGKIGEQIVFQAERNRLKSLGLIDLAKKVKLITQVDKDTTLDGMGYDLLSFNEQGEPIYIEVKTSYGKKDQPFFISQKEIDFLQQKNASHKFLYYVLIDQSEVTIKIISSQDLAKFHFTPVLYKISN